MSLIDRGIGSIRLSPRPLVGGGAALAISIFVGWGLATERHLSAIAALTLLAIVAIYLSIRPDLLFVAWLFAAPFLQNSARESDLGFRLVMVLYVLPLMIFAFHTLMAGGLSGRRKRWYDTLPILYVLFIVASQGVVNGADLRSRGFYTGLVYSGLLVGVILYYFCAFGPIEHLSKSDLAASVMAGSSIVAAMAIAEHFTRWNLWGQEFDSTPRRVISTLSNPTVLGAFLGVGAVVATAILIWEGPRALRLLSFVTLALTVPALYFTYTRAGMIAAAIMAFALVAIRPRKRIVGFGLAAVVTAVLIANWSALSATDVYQQRLKDTRNVQGRLLLSKASFELAAQRPVVGWGFGTFDARKSSLTLETSGLPSASLYYYTSHDTFLTILVELGILGISILIAPWAIVISKSLLALRRAPPAEHWFTLSLVAVFGVYVLTALSIDMRFFSFVPALAWIAVGLLRRDLADRA